MAAGYRYTYLKDCETEILADGCLIHDSFCLLYSIKPYRRFMFFRKALVTLRRLLLKSMIVLGFIFDRLNRNLFAVFALLFGLYLFLPVDNGSIPFTGPQLALWFDSLEQQSKVGLISALITVLGFFIAFSVGAYSWKSGALWQLNFELFSTVNKHYGEAQRVLIRISTFAKTVIELRQDAESGKPLHEFNWKLDFVKRDYPNFCRDREQLNEIVQESFSLSSRYALLLGRLWGVAEILNQVNEALSNVGSTYVYLPRIDENDTNRFAAFIYTYSQADFERFEVIVNEVEDFTNRFSALAGALNAQLLTPVMGTNLYMLKKMVFARDLDDHLHRIKTARYGRKKETDHPLV